MHTHNVIKLLQIFHQFKYRFFMNKYAAKSNERAYIYREPHYLQQSLKIHLYTINLSINH